MLVPVVGILIDWLAGIWLGFGLHLFEYCWLLVAGGQKPYRPTPTELCQAQVKLGLAEIKVFFNQIENWYHTYLRVFSIFLYILADLADIADLVYLADLADLTDPADLADVAV